MKITSTVCPQCGEVNPLSTKVCRNCNATFYQLTTHPNHNHPNPQNQSAPQSLEQKLVKSAKLVGVGFVLLVIGCSALLIFGRKFAGSSSFLVIVLIGGFCNLAATPLLLLGAIRGIYFSVRLGMQRKAKAFSLLFIAVLPLAIILLLVAIAGITYKGP